MAGWRWDACVALEPDYRSRIRRGVLVVMTPYGCRDAVAAVGRRVLSGGQSLSNFPGLNFLFLVGIWLAYYRCI